MTQAPSAEGVTGERTRRSLRSLLLATEVDTRLLGMIVALAIIWIGFNILSGGLFLTPRNLWNLSVQSSSIAIMATGMVLIIVSRNIDLSVGSLLGFLGYTMAMVQVIWFPTNPLTWLIALVVIGYGSVVISWNGTSQAEFAHLSPPGQAAPVAAVQTALAFLGAVFGPPIFALIAATVSYRIAFFAVAACVLAAAIWQLLAARKGSARCVT